MGLFLIGDHSNTQQHTTTHNNTQEHPTTDNNTQQQYTTALEYIKLPMSRCLRNFGTYFFFCGTILLLMSRCLRNWGI